MLAESHEIRENMVDAFPPRLAIGCTRRLRF
jgi:hypothetical protein